MYSYLNFTCTKDIFIYLNLCREEQADVERRLDEIVIKLFDPNRKELKQERKELKQRLKTIKYKIEKCIDLLESETIFKRDIFLKFLAKYLSLREGEEYVLMDDVVEDDFTMALATKTYPLDITSTEYNVITSARNKASLDSQGKNGSCGGTTDDITEYLLGCKDGKFICLKNDSTYSLLRGASLKGCYSKFPYLRELAFELVDLKLQNPNMSDIERLNKVLNELQKKKTYPHN